MQRKKLRASTARRQRGLGIPDELDYEEMSEPNMRLSRALLIVLVLHVVAVAGIIAFNTIKTRQVAAPSALEAVAPVSPATPVVSQSPSVAPNEAAPPLARTEKTPRIAKPVEPAKTSDVPDSGKTYVVAKGDNPVTIARKLHVNYDELIALNAIEDPRKLQIGQKLRVPERTTKSKHKTD